MSEKGGGGNATNDSPLACARERRPTQLYRHFDGEGRLLYVGISYHALIRLAKHRLLSSWVADIRSIAIEVFATRELAAEAERRAIENEKPIHNRAGNPLLRELRFGDHVRVKGRRIVSIFVERFEDMVLITSPERFEPNEDIQLFCGAVHHSAVERA